MKTQGSQNTNFSLGELFFPPPTSKAMRELSDRHSDTEVELGEEEHSELSSCKCSVSRSLSVEEIVVPKSSPQYDPPPEFHRAVHRIRLSALTHNYHQVEAAASRQRCAVITVVKADGYGHGAIATALHLADYCGADAFAVATLEEGIALRKAFAANPPGRWSKELASMFHTQHYHDASTSETGHPSYMTVGAPPTFVSDQQTVAMNRTPTMRPSQIRILVLGPPVGYPRCFHDYYHHNIEVMVSGPEVAASLMHWVADEAQRRKVEVERAANESMYQALYSYQDRNVAAFAHVRPMLAEGQKAKKDGTETPVTTATSTSDSCGTGESNGSDKDGAPNCAPKKVLPHQSSTLGNVQGADLQREVRTLILHQQEAKLRHQQNSNVDAAGPSETCSIDSSDSDGTAPTVEESKASSQGEQTSVSSAPASGTLFGGIEAAARSSRAAVAAAARAQAVLQEDDDDDESDHVPDAKAAGKASNTCAAPAEAKNPPPATRKRLRWHALVDSGMGRLGFRPEIVKPGDTTGRRDTVAVIKEMVDLEFEGNAPLEFYGMCTHMADARDLSDYTDSQINRFKALLKRVRAAGISVPTVSTDNSAALLTTSLTHFDPAQMLSQPGADTRGYVRTGGAIYGQRPAFKQLRAVSTLFASVRHVAILKKGDTVGYDRAYVAPYDVRIATLTIGFADGYPRELGNGVGKVQIRGSVFPVAGNVCMDMMMVDLGPANEKTGVGANVVVGDNAVLWGPLDEDVENGGDHHGMVRLQDIAATLKTTQSALTCGLDKMRVKRQFV